MSRAGIDSRPFAFGLMMEEAGCQTINKWQIDGRALLIRVRGLSVSAYSGADTLS